MKERFLKILALILVCLSLLFSLSVSSFSVTNLINDNLTASGWSWWSDSYTFTTNPALYYNSSTTASRVTIPANPSGSYAMRYTAVPSSSVFPNDTYTLSFDVYGDFSKCRLGIAVKLNGDNGNAGGAYLVTIYENFNNGNNIYTHGQVNFVPSNIASNVDRIQLELWFMPADYSSQVQLYIKNLSLTDVTDDSGMWSRLWSWLQDIYNQLIGLGNRITSNLTSLGSTIGGFFSDLWTDLKANLVGGVDSNGVTQQGLVGYIRTFFVNLGDSIGDFFDALYDYIMYFQHPVDLNSDGIPVDANGNPVYENPFEEPDFFDTIDDWIEDIEDSKSSIESGAEQGIDAIENVITPFNSVLNRVPVILIFITFGLAVIVIKKVIS